LEIAKPMKLKNNGKGVYLATKGAVPSNTKETAEKMRPENSSAVLISLTRKRKSENKRKKSNAKLVGGANVRSGEVNYGLE